MSRTIFAALAVAVAAGSLSGCAVYAPAPYGYYRSGVVVEPAPVIVAPGPYYYGWGYYHHR